MPSRLGETSEASPGKSDKVEERLFINVYGGALQHALLVQLLSPFIYSRWGRSVGGVVGKSLSFPSGRATWKEMRKFFF